AHGAPAAHPAPAGGPDSYRPTGYPIGGPIKPYHLLATAVSLLLLLVLALVVLQELLHPSRPPAVPAGVQDIGPPLPNMPPPGQPQPIDALRSPTLGCLYTIPSPLNQDFEAPNSAADFLHYQEGAPGGGLNAQGVALSATPTGPDPVHGARCLAVDVNFPLEAGAWKNADFVANPDQTGFPLGPVSALLFDVYVPPAVPGNIKAAFHLKDRHGVWFQAESSRRLIPGRWNTVFIDLRPRDGAVRPVGGAADFQRLDLSRAAGYGFSFYADQPAQARLYLDNIRALAGTQELPAAIDAAVAAWHAAASPEARHAARDQLADLRAADLAARRDPWPALDVTNLNEDGSEPPAHCFEPHEVQFNLTRQFANPYDPDQVEVWALVTPGDKAPPPPAGAEAKTAPAANAPSATLVDGFFLQPADTLNRFGVDSYRLTGPGVWAFRFTPQHTGSYRYALVVLDRRVLLEKLESTVSELLATTTPDPSAERRRHDLAGQIAAGLETTLRSEAAHPGGAGGVDDPASLTALLAAAARARGANDAADRTALVAATQAALARPALKDLHDLLLQGVPNLPDFAAAKDRYAAAVLADALLVTTFRPLLNAQPALPDDHGFVRVSRRDPHYFEYEDGTFFYPIGHNLRSPTDARGAMILDLPETRDRGLNTYRDFFRKMRANGENFCEVWMSSWFLDIEWTRRWQGYYGLTRYNQLHAARLDQLLDLARQYGIKLHFVLENHGKFSDWCDPEWDYSPYHEQLDGGKLTPNDFFSDADARAIYRKKLRYVLARWAGNPAIAGIEVVSEFDLTGGTGDPGDQHADRHAALSGAPVDWLKSVMDYIRLHDPYHHPLTNHYATGIEFIDWKSAREFFDYVVGDVYTGHKHDVTFLNHAIVFALRHLEAMEGKVKPFFITEYGGDWSGASPNELAGDLKAGIWSSWMSGAAGTPLLWWFDFIDQNDLYRFYRPFALYIAGEDPRGDDMKARIYTAVSDLGYNHKLYAPNAAPPTGPDAERLDYIVRCDWEDHRGKTATHGYGWILDREDLGALPFRPGQAHDRHSYDHVRLSIGNFQPGEYAVECWDTDSGKIVATLHLTVSAQDENGAHAQELLIPLPHFTSDMAFKIKPWIAPVPTPVIEPTRSQSPSQPSQSQSNGTSPPATPAQSAPTPPAPPAPRREK
ncbi:MAG: hypothetical protein ACREJ2_13075, partial [Planctomycetota bacterium]